MSVHHRSCRVPHAALGPGEPLPAGRPPGLRLLPRDLPPRLPGRRRVSRWFRLLWEPDVDLVAFHPGLSKPARVQLGLGLRAVLTQSRILGDGGILGAAGTLFFHLRLCGGHVSVGTATAARAGSLRFAAQPSFLCTELSAHLDGAAAHPGRRRAPHEWQLIAQVEKSQRERGLLCRVWRQRLLSALWSTHLRRMQRIFQGKHNLRCPRFQFGSAHSGRNDLKKKDSKFGAQNLLTRLLG